MGLRGCCYGLALAILWGAVSLGILYGAAVFAPTPWNMRPFLSVMMISWPLLAGFLGGWQDGSRNNGSGFAAALNWVGLPLILGGILWWWLLPQLWQAKMYGGFALYVILAALLCGGLGAGMAKAKKELYPPPKEEDK